ncbi:MAG: helix-turn-helix transcriptional regulator [Clostridia bacterium]|nr:helix-turn-helix transcriptional regulator [Clostridia bacterium]
MMYDGYSLMENKLEIRFMGADEKIFSEQTFFEGERMPFEIFFLIRKGRVLFTVDEKETVCETGAVMLVPYDAAYRVLAEKGSEVIFVAADYRVFTNLRIFSLFALPQRLEDPDGSIAALCASVHQTFLNSEFTNSRLENALFVNTSLYQLASAVLRRSYPKSDGGMVMARFAKLSPVLLHIGEHLDTVCPMKELAEIMNLSEDSFYRFFKKTVGAAPKEYLISERLRKARLYLLNTERSVADISRLCGYDNSSYFSTLFHEKYGLSPSAYREKTAMLI